VTDRHAGYLVTLASDVREDDAEDVMNALRMVRGVVAVTPVPIDPGAAIAGQRRDLAWRNALIALLDAGPEGGSGHAT
jgi:hypothetical protein